MLSLPLWMHQQRETDYNPILRISSNWFFKCGFLLALKRRSTKENNFFLFKLLVSKDISLQKMYKQQFWMTVVEIYQSIECMLRHWILWCWPYQHIIFLQKLMKKMIPFWLKWYYELVRMIKSWLQLVYQLLNWKEN